MQLVYSLVALFISYLIGSIPFGLLIVKLSTGKDIRHVESGRTGGTNAMRAAGFWAGLSTAVLDIIKSASTVWLTRWLIDLKLLPDSPWLVMLAPICAIIGHNYSIFLAERTEGGKVRLRGGAGGTPAVGGAFGLWAPSLIITVVIGILLLFGVGYASLATLSVGLVSAIIFAYRAWIGASPWEYVLYGLISFALLAWALRPNIKRLLNGTERLIGWRARQKK
ncbi:MAG TPA: glycerol-3-phosphate acyltransferase [Anaerolineales bacterium]|nr:glycerol-3-phosphate acyltransferase [Anaerolineales bacterium]